MFCCISKRVPQQPVISKKSGHLYEKRLIIKYIDENGTDPMTGETLTADDLLDVRSTSAAAAATATSSNSVDGTSSSDASLVAPRATNAAGIPGMLQQFANEWDALMLETFTLRQHLETVRQELSRALYQHDAACRVISRLVKERDEAKMALANAGSATVAAAVSAASPAAPAASAAVGAPSSAVVNADLPANVISNITSTSERLSAKRRKRKVDRDALPLNSLSSFTVVDSAKTSAVPTCIDSRAQDNLLVTGNSDGECSLFALEDGRLRQLLQQGLGHHGRVNDVLLHPTQNIVLSCSDDHTARMLVLSEDLSTRTPRQLQRVNSAAVTQVSLQPSGDYALCSSLDSTWSLHDLGTAMCITQSEHVSTANAGYSSCSFHPDGLIFGTGTVGGQIKIWDIKTRQNVKTFAQNAHTGEVTALSFSENGYYLASSSLDGTVKFWDLRHLENIHTIQVGSPVRSVRFDLSGVLCSLTTTAGELRIVQSKQWNEMMNLSIGASISDAAFIEPNARNIVVTCDDQQMRLIGAPNASMEDE